MTPENHIEAANDLLNAEEKGEQIRLLTQRYPEMGMDDAYAVQNAIYRAKLQQGRTVVGWKIGLTSKAMQYALNINIPDSGILFDDMIFSNGAIVPKKRFIPTKGRGGNCVYYEIFCWWCKCDAARSNRSDRLRRTIS